MRRTFARELPGAPGGVSGSSRELPGGLGSSWGLPRPLGATPLSWELPIFGLPGDPWELPRGSSQELPGGSPGGSPGSSWARRGSPGGSPRSSQGGSRELLGAPGRRVYTHTRLFRRDYIVIKWFTTKLFASFHSKLSMCSTGERSSTLSAGITSNRLSATGFCFSLPFCAFAFCVRF